MAASIYTNTGSNAASDFDLDVTVVATGSIVVDILADTSDNCTSTCQSACSNSNC